MNDAMRTEDHAAAMQRLSDALSGTPTPQWQIEQQMALGGDEPSSSFDDVRQVPSNGQIAADDMTRVAERFRPAPALVARSRE